MSWARITLFVCSLFLLLLTIACGGASNAAPGTSNSGGGSQSGGGSGGGGSTNTPPPGMSFSASPTSAAPGQMVQFTWSSTNATSVAFNPSIAGEDETQTALSGSKLLAAPNSTTTYTATAKNATGQTASQVVTITVAAPTLTANPTNIPAGQTSTLSWTAPDNGSTLTLSGVPNGPITLNAATGSMQVQPGANTTYTLSATGPNGGVATAQATVTVQNPVKVNLTPTTQTIQAGGSANITWSTQNAVSLTINGQTLPRLAMACTTPAR